MDMISFPNGNQAITTRVTDFDDIPNAIKQLGIPDPHKTIVVIGGAGGISWINQFAIWKAADIIASLAGETNAIVLDGGTNSGIMSAVGQQRKRNFPSFQLIGVIAEGVLDDKKESMLEPNHSHFLFVPGTEWGDESEWIAKAASIISGNEKSITILVNGGQISKKDVENSLKEDRMVVAIRGTGRLADELKESDREVIALNILKTRKKGLTLLMTLLS